MNTKIFMTFLMVYVIAQVLCNIVDGNTMFTNTNVADINSLSSASVTSSSDSSGTPAQYVAMGDSFFTTIGKVAFFDYTLFRNLDGTANDWVIIRYLLICWGIVTLVEAAVVFRQIIAG
jgi:hypothetical protein